MQIAPLTRGEGSYATWLRRFLILAALSVLVSAVATGATYSIAGFSDTAVAQGLSSPTDFDWTPDGRMLILEKAGNVRIVVGGALQTTPALNWVANVDSGSEKGLLGICIDPNFGTNGYVYLYYTTKTPKNRISRFTMVGDTLDALSETVILDNIDATNGNHNGGTLLIGPDGKLWAAPGDSGTGGAKSQDTSTGHFNGKVLRMELDGSPAAGNPFIGSLTAEERIFAYGFRNPFRFSFRPSNGALFVGDVGENTYEEVDVVTAGNNYGWPAVEGPSGACPYTSGCLGPIFYYDHTVGQSIIGGIFVTSAAYPAVIQGKYLVADYSAKWIRFLDVNASNMVMGGLQNFATADGGAVSFKTGPDGLVYFAALDTGRIYRINPPASKFNTLTPCRVVNTRNANGPYGGPALTAGAGGTRSFHLGGQCNIPSSARAVAVNVTVAQPAADGDLRIYPTGAQVPATSVINFRAGQTRANNAVLLLSPTGDISVRYDAVSGTVQFLLDVDGYFE
ncbi:MAG TPA: PQQ-dependent sugar dehydrogenase [Thermoanaerobaculia bacterium]|nr:PQQ-dependent sugar dehydrogenase [Thermoanaerobaculia bacterium]